MLTEEKIFKTYEKELKEFEDWILEHPRLPKKINKLLLIRFLKVYDFNIEEAKKLYIIFHETRKHHPNIFHNRDVFSEDFQTIMSLFRVVGLQKTTKENHKITVFQLVDDDASKFSYPALIRLVVAMLDIRFIHCDENEILNGEISVVDVKNFSFKHFLKIITHIGTMRAYMTYAQEAAPIRIVQTHFINSSPVIGKVLSVMKPFTRKEVFDSIKIHSSLESLYEYVPKEILPEDFGGSAPSLDEHFKLVKESLERNRDYLMCDDNWRMED